MEGTDTRDQWIRARIGALTAPITVPPDNLTLSLLETEQRFSLAFPMARVTLAIIAKLGRERQKFHPLKRMQ